AAGAHDTMTLALWPVGSEPLPPNQPGAGMPVGGLIKHQAIHVIVRTPRWLRVWRPPQLAAMVLPPERSQRTSVVSLDGPPDAQQASDSVPSTPAMPRVPSSEVYRGTPQLLGYGFRHSHGWQDFRKVGPSFVVVRTGSYRLKVTQRFPLTEQGWSLAWDALISRDPAAAEQIRAKLAKREVR